MPVAYIIDDSRATGHALAQWLALLGYEPRVMLGPRPAIEALAQLVPDLIFLDIHMQGMDGVEVCRYIRRDPRLAAVPLIAMSAESQPALVERVRLAGANGFLAKPLDYDAFEATVRAAEKFYAARPPARSFSRGFAPRPIA